MNSSRPGLEVGGAGERLRGGRGGGELGEASRPIGGEQLVDPAGRVRRDSDEHVGKVVEHIDVGALARLDERVDRRGGASSAHAAGDG
jgi:hypothetical protein